MHLRRNAYSAPASYSPCGGQLLAGADYCGLDEESLRLGFNLVVAEWAA